MFLPAHIQETNGTNDSSFDLSPLKYSRFFFKICQNKIYILSFQVCTELSLPAGSNNKTDMFSPLPWTSEMISTYCQKKWGVVPQPNWAPIQLWGKGWFP